MPVYDGARVGLAGGEQGQRVRGKRAALGSPPRKAHTLPQIKAQTPHSVQIVPGMRLISPLSVSRGTDMARS
eukprot:3940233-Rhodomonas_salina.2